MTTESEAAADKLNAKLGLSGWRGQVAQFGGIAIIFAAFLMLLVWFRNDGKAIVSDLLRQQSIERAEDREMRSQDRAEDRAARKEAAQVTAAAMEKLAGAIGEFRVEIRTRDDKWQAAMEKLTDKIDKMK